MLLRYFYDKRLAQASYMVGCAATGEALIVDPNRDIAQYLRAAEEEGLRITHVTETHIHADFVSGSRELAAATGARMYLSDMGDENWKYAFADQPNVMLVRDGDRWMVGNIRVEVLHTPGHTPEHISFMITDTAGADRPMGVFTGDFVFVGDIGRPDLLEEAAGMIGTKEVGARQQFLSVQRFKALPDYLQIWPAHGAGSACGKALGAVPSTTLGYEKLFSPAFQFEEEQAFVDWLLSDQPEAPYYFAQMKKVNKLGPALLEELEQPVQLDTAVLKSALKAEALVFDLRAQADFRQQYVPGTVSIPATETGYINHVGWFVDYSKPSYLVLPEETALDEVLTVFRSIGIDDVPGYFLPEQLGELTTESLPMIDAAGLAARLDTVMVLDVRGKNEYREGHIPGATHIALGYLPKNLMQLPTDTPIVTQCAGGYRSHIAASLLRRYGFNNIINLEGGFNAWTQLQAEHA
ncbi:MAG: MBL fold metallo-hydrolase [Anaerolineae bacterium]